MRSRVFSVFSARPSRLAAISAVAALALLLAAAQSAIAATPLDEGLTGTGTSTGGSSYGFCPHDYLPDSGSTGFSASGTASGPYPGSFSETGIASVLGLGGSNLYYASFNATFTITSGTTTISGSLAGTQTSLGVGGLICDSAHKTVGFRMFGLPVTYTATINGQTLQGAGSVSGTFYTATGAKDSVFATLRVPGGQIAGTVTDSDTSAPIAGICVHAYNSSGDALASTQTGSNGAYALSGVPSGSVQIGFSTGCGAGNYLPQYYNAQPSLASADPVSVTAGETTSGIDAAMVGHARIRGTVTASVTQAPLAGICVRAYNTSGGVAASSKTKSSGDYTIGALPTGSYRVGFIDCTHHRYRRQYYNDKWALANADPIPLLTAATRSGINAALVK